ncbi:MAG: hypothetical protein ACRYGK_09875 [Janthinobacterium lividum]
MDIITVEYSGYQIAVTPSRDHSDLWDYSYRITKDGDAQTELKGHSANRRGTLGGYQSAQTACDAGIEVAKVEVDNHLALHPD